MEWMTRPSATSNSTGRPSGQTLLLAASVAGSCLLVGYLLFFHSPGATADNAADPKSRLTLADIPFDGQRAYDYLNELCALGPRVSGSQGMQAQQELLTSHFRKLGGTVRCKNFASAIPRRASRCRWPI